MIDCYNVAVYDNLSKGRLLVDSGPFNDEPRCNRNFLRFDVVDAFI